MRNLFLCLFMLLICCNKSSEKKYSLSSKYTSTFIQGKPSVDIEYSNSYMTLSIKYGKGNKLVENIKVFKKVGLNLYEQKLIKNFDNKVIDTLYILALAQSDTIVEYRFNRDKYIPTMLKGFDDWAYHIHVAPKKQYELIKKHLCDSTPAGARLINACLSLLSFPNDNCKARIVVEW